MALNDRSKSILLQVAFKAAVELGDASVPNVTHYYTMLVDLHEQLGINPDASSTNYGSGTRKSNTSGGRKPISGNPFVAKGESWIDYRQAKANDEVKQGFPDFKTPDNKRSIWMYDKEGNPNPEAADLVRAADANNTEVF